jgi:phospholipid transport system substrate-binding protein
MKYLFALFSVPAAYLACVMAQETALRRTDQDVTNEVLDIVRKDKDIQSGNTKKAIELVEAKVLPHFNFTRMTQLALARDWRQANPSQQKGLDRRVSCLAGAHLFQGHHRIQESDHRFQALCRQAGETDVRVRTEIKQSGAGKNIELDYYLEKSRAGWKVYDIEVGGISLVTNYRVLCLRSAQQWHRWIGEVAAGQEQIGRGRVGQEMIRVAGDRVEVSGPMTMAVRRLARRRRGSDRGEPGGFDLAGGYGNGFLLSGGDFRLDACRPRCGQIVSCSTPRGTC